MQRTETDEKNINEIGNICSFQVGMSSGCPHIVTYVGDRGES